MADVLTDFEVTVDLVTYTRTTVDFAPVMTPARVSIKAVVQPAQREKVQALGLDLTLRHIEVHSTTNIAVGQFIEFGGRSYKVITPGDYELYGFADVICAEVKGAIT
jgi:hypothetical protein